MLTIFTIEIEGLVFEYEWDETAIVHLCDMSDLKYSGVLGDYLFDKN